MELIIVTGWKNAKGHRMQCVFWFAYHFLMVTLCIVNLMFFLCNFCELEFDPNDSTNMLITFVGFLFAFAGINIYSIFNTNIEEEKQRLVEVSDLYNKKIEESKKEIEFTTFLVELNVLNQQILATKRYNNQLAEWIIKATKILNKEKTFIKERNKTQHGNEMNPYLQSIADVTRGMKYSLELVRPQIETEGFFSNQEKSMKPQIQRDIESLSSLLNSFINGSAFDDNPEVNPQSQAKTTSFLSMLNNIKDEFVKYIKQKRRNGNAR